jgi:hypothetical protein
VVFVESVIDCPPLDVGGKSRPGVVALGRGAIKLADLRELVHSTARTNKRGQEHQIFESVSRVCRCELRGACLLDARSSRRSLFAARRYQRL